MRLLVLGVIVGLVGGGVPARTAIPSDRHFVTLCNLQLKPGNAFTFVRPQESELTTQGAALSTINVTYVGFAAKPGAQAAFEFAVGIWRSLLSSPVPIQVRAEFTTLGPGQLGSAGAQISHFGVLGLLPYTFYGDPIADRLTGSDQNPSQFDILSQFSDTADWYFGTDGNVPAGKVDFVSVVLHELGHGFGFQGSPFWSLGVGSIGSGGIPDIFDRFVETETGFPILGFQNDSTALGTQMTQGFNAGNPHGPGLYWGGANGKAANGGVTPRLYTPSTWDGGSSYSHLEEELFPAGNPNSLMTHQLQSAEAIHSPGPITMGMLNDISWMSQPELLVNGNFNSGMTGWQVFEPPDIVNNSAANGQFEYHRANPTSSPTGQAVVFQATSTAFGAGQQLHATWRMGNSSSVRKRFSVLIWSTDFSDLHVCTFWLPPGAPLLQYQMVTHTTKAWPAAQIHFYAASSGSNGGNYQLDDVSLKAAPVPTPSETRCVDPWFALATPTSDSAELLVNGNFNNGTNNWSPFNNEVHQVTGGVYEFARDNSTGFAGGVLQSVAGPIAEDKIVTARFQLGNSSSVRKRVTMLLHDLSFTDLSACTFWLAPNQPLTPYLMRTYVTTTWNTPTLSLYVATIGPEHWIQFDNASFVVTPSTQTFGTECGEPNSALVANGNVQVDEGGAAQASVLQTTLRSPSTATGRTASPRTRTTERSAPARISPDADVSTPGSLTTQGNSGAPWVVFHIPPSETTAPYTSIQVSGDGVTWRTVARIRTPDDWTSVALQLDELLPAEERQYVRLVPEIR